MARLDGKVALVTGAASGIGAALARRLADVGAIVVGTDVADAAGEDLFAELAAPHFYARLDVTDADAWTRLVERLDRLDIVCLNAGVMTRPPDVPMLDDPVDWLRADSWRRVMGVNADGVAFGLVAAIPALERSGGGDIVVTASTAGVQPLEPDPIYAASKYALVGLTRSLGPSLARRGIRINAVCPHSILTGIIPVDLRDRQDKVFSPPSYIADSVLRVLEFGDAGRVWIARREDEPAWPIEYEDVIPREGYIAERAR